MNTQLSKNKTSGFTIVELLIVIVVIGILAAIVIVAFNGVQARANTTASKSAASTIQKKAEAYNSIRSSYPTSIANFNAEEESKLTGSGVSLGATLSDTTGKNTAVYSTCGTTGFRVQYWDYSASPHALSTLADSLHGGSATAATTGCTVVSS